MLPLPKRPTNSANVKFYHQVDAAKRAREEREKSKRLEASISRIQSAWRSALSLRKAQREVASSWALRDSFASPPTASLLLQGLRQFNFFFPSVKCDENSSPLLVMMRLVGKSILLSDPALNLAALAHENPSQWVLPMRKFLVTLQKHVLKGYTKPGGVPDLNLAVQLLVFFTDSLSVEKYACQVLVLTGSDL